MLSWASLSALAGSRELRLGAGDRPQAPKHQDWGSEGRLWAWEGTLEQRAKEKQCAEGSTTFPGCGKFVRLER